MARPAHASDAGVIVVATFPANKGPGWKDSIDVAGAVGPRHVVDFDVAGRRLDSVFVRDGSVFGCNGAKRTAESRPGILWYEVRIRDGALVQEGFVDSPDRDFIYPSVAVDSQGNIGIGCTGTSENEFPSVYVMMRAASDPPNTMRRPVPAVPGTTIYRHSGARAVNLSHYSATCIDPTDPDLLWTCQAYANSTVDKQWCTAWAAFQLSESERSTSDATSATTERPGKFNVKDFGAIGDGVADDTSGIQSAIDAAARNAGGGTVLFPKGTYLLNSAYPSSHPWGFHNLLIDSGVTLLGETGAKLVQGPKGRHPLPEGAEAVRNTVLAFGADHEVIRFQNRAYNRGFFSLQATIASSTMVTLKTPSDSSKFQPGDYVAIYETTEGDVIPTETGQITTVNASTGELGLKDPLSRSFQTPSIANVTRLATTNVGIRNLIVEGSEPLTVTEVFGFTAEDCHFINDTSFTGNTVVVKGSAMGVRGEGPPPQSLTITNNTFRMGKGAGIMIASHGVDGSTVTGNTIAGSGAYGIYVASPAQPNDGKHVIHGNTVTGYGAEVFMDPALHPGTVLTDGE